ncbi:MAG: hypothetical protein GXO91_10495 [FCB group bacterium]|nr:hypothetical protein [FCB group bacterium]
MKPDLPIKLCCGLLFFVLFSGGAAGSVPDTAENNIDFERFAGKIYKTLLSSLQIRHGVHRTMGFADDLFASAPNDSVIIQFLPDPEITLLSAAAFVSMDEQQSWHSGPCQQITDLPGYENYWDCTVPTGGGDDMAWYIRLVTDAGMGVGLLTQSPKNIIGEFPPGDNYLISVADEPVGDVLGDHAFLDISALSATYNDESLFVRITVNEGGFYPGDFFGPWYLYGVGFSNPEQDLSADTLVVYSLGYGDGAFGNLYPGLLKLWGTPDGEFIDYQYVTEDIQWAISENNLDMAIATHYITDDPDFGPWPNPENALLLSGMTASTTLDIDFEIFDDTVPAMLILETNFQNGNDAPTLSLPVFDPDNLTLEIHYADVDHNLAVTHSVSLNQAQNMVPLDLDFASDVIFSYGVGNLDAGDYTAWFDFSDGSAETMLEYPFTVVNNGCNPQGDLSGDGALDILDVVTVIAVIIDGGFDACGDVNGDGALDVSDVLVMVATIMESRI